MVCFPRKQKLKSRGVKESERANETVREIGKELVGVGVGVVGQEVWSGSSLSMRACVSPFFRVTWEYCA